MSGCLSTSINPNSQWTDIREFFYWKLVRYNRTIKFDKYRALYMKPTKRLYRWQQHKITKKSHLFERVSRNNCRLKLRFLFEPFGDN